MKEEFLFYDNVYGPITTIHEEYLEKKRKYNKAKSYQVFLATSSIIFNLMSVLCLVLGIVSSSFESFKAVGLIFLALGLVLAILVIFNDSYMKSKEYVEHFKLTREYQEQIKREK